MSTDQENKEQKNEKELIEKIKKNFIGNFEGNPKDIIFYIFSDLTHAETINDDKASFLWHLHEFFTDLEKLNIELK
jgi:hypothetical protein